MPGHATSSRAARSPAVLRIALVLAVPFMAAVTVVGTYIGKEIILLAMWVGVGLMGALVVNPVVGVVVMSAMFLLAAYPTLLKSFGMLTVNNLLGIGLAALLVGRVLETRDLSFLRNRQVLVLAAIGLGLMAATYHASVIFPLLEASRGKMYILDRSAHMGHDFFARLVFLVFFLAFVRTRRDVGALFLTFMLALFLAVPSALVNWATGELNRGFRVMSSVTVGANPNRLAMICLMEIACWWFWGRARADAGRRLVAAGAIVASLLVLLATGSRSGLLGCGALLLVLQTGPRHFRVPARHVALMVVAGLVIVATVVPTESLKRMVRFFPEAGEVGASSITMREETLETGTRMVRDHPVLGIGLGKFREVSRQVYGDKYYRPPHNSFLWAASEGGLLTLSLYLLLFWMTWRDLRVVTRLAHRDHSVAHVAAAVRAVFLLYCFFAFFADLFLNPITYIVVGLVIVMRRYLESLPEPAMVVAPRPMRWAPRAA